MVSSSLVEQRQAEDKAAWDAYWKLRDLDSRGTIFPRMRYYVHKAFDAPATWFRGEHGGVLQKQPNGLQKAKARGISWCSFVEGTVKR